MPSPSTSLSTLRPELASMLEFDLAADRQGFIAQRVLPVLEVAKPSGTFGLISLEESLQDRETKRAPGSGYSRGKFTFTTKTYACEENGAEEPVDDKEAQLYKEYFDAETIVTQRTLDVVLRKFERTVADLIFNATTWTGASLTTAVTNEWDDSLNATPITDVAAAVIKIYDGTGLWPNALIINKKVFLNLRASSQIQDRIASEGAGNATKAADITTQMLAQVFDLDYVIFAGSSKNSAHEGQTASISQIWSDEYAMVAKIATDNDIQTPCLGRTFHWGEDGSQIGGMVESYRDEPVRSNIIRVRNDTDVQVFYKECGHLLSNITT